MDGPEPRRLVLLHRPPTPPRRPHRTDPRLQPALCAGRCGVSVMHFKPATDPDAFFPNSFLQARCYYCGAYLGSPFVMWQGAGDPLALPPSCTVELTIRLLRDVHQVECETSNDITRPKPGPADQLT